MRLSPLCISIQVERSSTQKGSISLVFSLDRLDCKSQVHYYVITKGVKKY